MPSSPAVGAPSCPTGSAGGSCTATGPTTDPMPRDGMRAPPSLPGRRHEDTASGWPDSSMIRGSVFCLVVLLAGAGAAVAQDGEDLEALSRDPGQRVTAPNYAGTRFGELDQSNVGYVDPLQLAWSFSVGANRPGSGAADRR